MDLFTGRLNTSVTARGEHACPMCGCSIMIPPHCFCWSINQGEAWEGRACCELERLHVVRTCSFCICTTCVTVISWMLYHRQRLASVLDAHGLQKCHGQPRFVLDTALMSNAPSLLMTCDTCGALHVVI